MKNNLRYPNLGIRSKNELAKRLSNKRWPKNEVIPLINDVKDNFEKYWRDNKSKSEPQKGKYVRSAKYTPLGRILAAINEKVLGPNDRMLPGFIFGGVKEKNHALAAAHLLGKKRRRVAIKMDITRFFEQISSERVFYFFNSKCGCPPKISRLMADLCCVPLGPKGSTNINKTIGRGFATSSRLAVWCNLDTFIRLDYLVKRRLKNRDPRIAIYVDDIGITASRITKEEMKLLTVEVKDLLENFDKNQPLPIKDEKTKVTSHEEGIEHLGLKLNRNSLSVTGRARGKRDRWKAKLKTPLSKTERKNIKQKYRSQTNYKRYVEGIVTDSRTKTP